MATKTKIPPNAGLLNSFHLLAFDELDSTNEEAKRIARTGGSHGAVVWAKKQTAGRGRMDRTWESKEGNLFISILLKPGCDLATASQLSLVTAVAVREALTPLLPEDAVIQCKWPNDVLINGKKVAGILLESFLSPNDNAQWVIVGIGVNIDHFPRETLFPATALKAEGVELISAKIVLSRLIHHFIVRYNGWTSKGFDDIRKVWQRHAWLLKKRVRMVLPQEEVEGLFEGLHASGSLILKLEDGRQQVIPAGDMFSLREAATTKKK